MCPNFFIGLRPRFLCVCGITFTDNSHGVTLSGSKIDRSLFLVRLSRTLGSPESQVHLSSFISDRNETRTEVGQSVGLLHGSTSYNEWQHEVSASSPVGPDEVAGSTDGDGSSVDSNIMETVAEVILQPTVVPSNGGDGGGNDRGWSDDDKEKNKKNSESMTKITDFIDRVTGVQRLKFTPPSLPKSKAEVIPFLKKYPLYVVKRFCHSRHVRKLIRICMCTLWTVFLCALCIIANDNARLRTIEEKYILLRDFSRLDDRTSQRADYIEYFYSDEDEHRQEIDELWLMRKQRLNNNKK